MYLLPVQGHAGPHGPRAHSVPLRAEDHELNHLRVLLSRLPLGPGATGGRCSQPVDGCSQAVTKKMGGKVVWARTSISRGHDWQRQGSQGTRQCLLG